MLRVEQTTDVEALSAFLQQDRAYAAYALGDLEPPYWRDSAWFIARRNGEIEALALVYSGLEPPALFTMGALQGLQVIMMQAPLPAQAAIVSRWEHLPVMQARYSLPSLHPMLRMGLERAAFRPAADHPALRRLQSADVPALLALYAQGGAQAPDAFDPSQVERGVFYGAGEGAALIAAGGTHLVAPGRGVGAIGNVFTHPDQRNRGWAARIVSKVAAHLLDAGLTVVLNVGADNAPALTVYHQLGFRPVCRFVEGVGQQIESHQSSVKE